MAIPKIGMVERHGPSERQPIQPSYKSPKEASLVEINQKTSHINTQNKPHGWYFDTISICSSLSDGPDGDMLLLGTLELSHDC